MSSPYVIQLLGYRLERKIRIQENAEAVVQKLRIIEKRSSHSAKSRGSKTQKQ